jgi:DNA polymerase-3 subunit gamma/tau
VDRVIETGQDPRRFTEDLLRRLRDLVIVAAVPDAPATGLIDVSADQADRLVQQANHFGPAELSRAADLVATGLTEMRGATAPRLLLELICARVLLPGSDPSSTGLQARVDRLEKRASIAGGAPSPAPVREETAPPAPEHPVEPVADGPAPEPPQPAPEPPPVPEPVEASPASPPETPQPEPRPEPVTTGAAPSGALSLVDVRRLWPDIVEATKLRRRVAWMHLTQNSQVVGVDGATLTLGFANAGARDSFVNGGCDEILRQAAIDIAGVDWKVETIVDPGAAGGAQGAAPPASPPSPPPPEPPADEDEPATVPSPAPDASAAAREAIRTTRPSGPSEPATDDDPAASDADAHPDDPDADTSGLAGAELLQRELGAEVIEEIRHQ